MIIIGVVQCPTPDSPRRFGPAKPDPPLSLGALPNIDSHALFVIKTPSFSEGAVAQLGERLVRNEEVASSILVGSTIPNIYPGPLKSTTVTDRKNSIFGF